MLCYLDNEDVVKGGENELKSRISITIAINLRGMIYYKIIENNVNSSNFNEFINEFVKN